MAQRYEIEAWVNPGTWDDEAQAQEVIDRIEESGSDGEADWVRIAAEVDELSPAGSAREVLAAAARDDERAQGAADEARGALREATLHALRMGMSEAEAARVAGVTRVTVRAWAGK